MTSPSSARKTGSDRGDYGFARARDLAFDAVVRLWRKRRSEGMQQKDIADILNRSPTWVSRQLKGPSNWTLRTIGEFVEALDGEVEIFAYPLEEPVDPLPNYDAYLGYGRDYPSQAIMTANSAQVIYRTPRYADTSGVVEQSSARLELHK